VNLISLNVAKDGAIPTATQIDKIDMDEIVIPNICKIMTIYTIPSELCNTADLKAVPDDLVVEQ